MITAGERGRRSLSPRHPAALDVVVAAAVLVVDLVLVPRLGDGGPLSPPQVALAALALAAVPLRHRLPVPALAVTTALVCALLLVRGVETLAVLAPLAPLYTVALRGDRGRTALAWAATTAPLLAAAAVSAPGDALAEALRLLPWTAVVATIGAGVRDRRAYLAAVEERAERAEATRESEALRAVAEERVRIARDLHDVVAHHIAVVSVQAGVAEHLLPTDPGASARAMGTVRRAAAAVLEELGDVLSVLREPGEPDAARAPAPGLARLDELVASFVAAGLDVDWSLTGRVRELAPTVDLVAYRVVEEGLTNAFKHGAGSTHLDVEYRPEVLVLRLVNATPASPVLPGGHRGSRAGAVGTAAPARPAADRATGGHGLVGMRERAAAVGGTLVAEATPGATFRVEAALPLRRGAS